jgi:hypothetical protein
MQDFTEILGSIYFLAGNEAGFVLLLGFAWLACTWEDIGPPGGLRSWCEPSRRFDPPGCAA